MASVSKREWTHNDQLKSAWVVRYTDQGGKRRMKTCATKKEADRERTKIETEIENKIHVPERETLLVRDAANAWIKHCEHRARMKDEMTYATLKGYRRYAETQVVPKLGNLKMTHLNAVILQEWVDDLAAQYQAPTVRTYVVVIKQIIKFSVVRGWIKRNFLKDQEIRYPRRERKVQVPSVSDLKRLLAAANTRQYKERSITHLQKSAAVNVAIFAGLRRGEVVGLQWECIDFKSETIKVRHSLSATDGLKGPKTKAGVRDVPMAPQVRKALGDLHEHHGQPSSGYVFINRDGRPLTPVGLHGERFGRAMQQAGFLRDDGSPKFRLHDLRHAAVSLLIAEGLSPLHISRMIGHSSVSTTMDIYGHLFPEDVAVRASVMSIGSRLGATSVEHGAPSH